MEERIIDDEEARLIKIKRTKNGDDVVEDTGEAPEADAEQEETEDVFTVEFADDDNYDEDLVGLTPTQLKEELERRERIKREAREKCDECIRAGKTCLEDGDFDGACENFSLALTFVWDDEEAHKLLWQARTKNHTALEAYYNEEYITELLSAPEAVKTEVLSRDGEKLQAERIRLQDEIAPLRKEVMDKRAERREPLLQNKNYYRLRLMIFAIALACCAIAAGISGYYTVRTLSIAPVVTAAVFGGCAGIFLVLSLIYTRFWLVALRLFNANENINSTADGRKLTELEESESALALLLDGDNAEEEEAE